MPHKAWAPHLDDSSRLRKKQLQTITMKDRKDVVSEFSELVNMTASELEEWLKSDDSNSAGWAEGDGESVGHGSGRKIVEILKANPEKKADQYSDEDVEHMRKVVAYCKRHLVQEKGPNISKSEEEVKKTKSYASLKNWGHDFLKGAGTEGGMESEPGEKRKTWASQAGAKKGHGTAKGGRKTEGEDEGAEKDNEDEGDKEDSGGKQDEDKVDDDKDDKPNDNAKEDKQATDKEATEEATDKSESAPEKGDAVSWKWGAGHPQGTVLDVKQDKATITTKNGNKVSRDGTEDDPAVVLDAGSSKAVKLAHELD
ncbi:hypothetical protein GGTG_08874 [Gaeumannomyces tritici R3-111a-1]|uniref:Hypervirulence associated protein TUDOR domain-containing protein n=1 Tax=Gaeumannomyces tritici (strain R3-111a-1) TaxID=644352 RepID=J3P5T4_GAET3|nr:hypothetical protein GGTG_08874 [Gaeumannomyces tritici R3-111a-1]EJT75036.1 hypothetical protein GGTG_08874 [Gaeumannomyces tritici R3-111a-1]